MTKRPKTPTKTPPAKRRSPKPSGAAATDSPPPPRSPSRRPEAVDSSSPICGALLSPYHPWNQNLNPGPRYFAWVVCNRARGHTDVLAEPPDLEPGAQWDTDAHQAVDPAGLVLTRVTEDQRRELQELMATDEALALEAATPTVDEPDPAAEPAAV